MVIIGLGIETELTEESYVVDHDHPSRELVHVLSVL